MSSSSLAGLVQPRPAPIAAARRTPSEPPRLWRWWVWVLVCAAVLAVAIWLVHWSSMRPSYDPFGWLTWGKKTLQWDLNLNAAPSWKPLPFIFTLPYTLFGTFSVELWSVTATAGMLFMGVFAGRIAYRLSDVGRGSGRWALAAAWIGALFAAVGAVGIEGLPQLTYTAYSDPLNTALVLGAIDAHVSRRPRLAFVVLFFAALGRPEVWVFSGLYGLWLIWKVPGTRLLVVGGWVLILLCWFVPDAIAAKSIFQAGNLDLNKSTACHTGKVICVAGRWAALYEWPMQAAALIGAAIAFLRRDRRIIILFGLALLWVLVEIAFALHGWSATPRYVMESAAVMVVIAGVGVTWLLRGLEGARLGRISPRVVAVAGPLIVLGLLVALAPFAHDREFRWRIGAENARYYGVINRHLPDAVRLAGGSKAILACGQVAAKNQYQSQLAWAMDVNVANVLYKPPLLKRLHTQMVLFTKSGQGWIVRAYNEPSALASRCAHVDVHTADVNSSAAPAS